MDEKLWKKGEATPRVVIRQDPGSAETRAAALAAALLGISARSCALGGLEHLAAELRDGALPVGSVEFVREAMRVAGVAEPANMTYPQELGELLKRSVTLSTADAARAPGPARFAKPESTKAFTGFVHDPSVPEAELGEHEREQRAALLKMEPNAPVWIGSVVEFVAEWRAYMHGSRVVGLERYDPDGPDGVEEPRSIWVEQAARAWLDAPGAPAACAIDVGRLADGSLALVEVNDAWALGLYGRSVDAKDYLAMLGARWSQILAEPRLTNQAGGGPPKIKPF